MYRKWSEVLHSFGQTWSENQLGGKACVSVASKLYLKALCLFCLAQCNLSLISLDAVDPNAYDAFKASRNLGDVIDRVLRNQQEASNGSGPRKILSVEASLMTPVQPMLVWVSSVLPNNFDETKLRHFSEYLLQMKVRIFIFGWSL